MTYAAAGLETRPYFRDLITDSPEFNFNTSDIGRVRDELKQLITNLSPKYFEAKAKENIQVKGRVSIGKAVFTIGCELVLRVEEEPHRLQIKYKRVDNVDAPEICHNITEEDVDEMKLFEHRLPTPKGEPKKYLTMRAQISEENGLQEYYDSGTYSPAPDFYTDETTDEGLGYINYITFEIGISKDDSVAGLENALKDANFKATNIPNVSESLRDDSRTKPKGGERRENTQPTDTLFVFNFHEETTSREDLQMLFEPFDQHVRINMKSNYAFVHYTTVEAAKNAKEATDGGKLDSSVITVKFVDPRISNVATYVGAFLFHNGAAEEAPIEMSGIQVPRVSVGNKVYSAGCHVAFLPDVGFPTITVSYEQDDEQVKHVIFANSVVDLYMTPAKLPPAPGNVPTTRYYVVMNVHVDGENRLPSVYDEESSIESGVSVEDDKIVVIEIDQKPDYKRWFRALSSDPGFRNVAHEGLKPFGGSDLNPQQIMKAITRDLAPMARDNQRKTKLKDMRHFVAYPKDFDQRQRQCFVCDREYRYFNDELVAMMPCCGALACITCIENIKIDDDELKKLCQCGAALTTSDVYDVLLLHERSETKPYAQYIMGIYIVGIQPDVEIAVSISTTMQESMKRRTGLI